MQLAIGMDRLGSSHDGAASPRMLADVNRTLAQVRVRFLDKDDQVTFTSHRRLVAGGAVGAREGYATLRDALEALAGHTRGDAPAAAVLERAGRYYGHVLKGRDLEQGLRAPLRPLHLEADERTEVVELRAADRHERVLAFVDGTWRHRFRG